jgi:glutathione synthase/RimK-type ligase-like ATP-grasp enzyme
MSSFINQAAYNRGWEMKKILSEDGDYLTKYTKGKHFFYCDGVSSIPINHQSLNLSLNKVYTSYILEEELLPCISTRELKLDDWTKTLEMYEHFSEGGQTNVVVKPIDGKKGEGLISINSSEGLHSFFISAPRNRRYCISSYFPHQCEVRFVVFQNIVQFHYLKPNNRDNPLRPFLTENVQLNEPQLTKLKTLAEKAAKCLGFDYIAIDFLIGKQTEKIIEINTKPNLYAYIRQHPNQHNTCVQLYEKIFDYKEQLLSGSGGQVP